jgi:hypothetical protein
MAVPQVTFPLTPEQVKPAYEMLTQHLKGLQADTRITQELLRLLPTFCAHAKKSRYSCPDCGLSWSDGD